MRILITFLVFAVTSFVLSGCGAGPANNANTAGANNAAGNNPLETTKATPDQVTNDAPTLTPLMKAYCAAKMKKDEAALRKIFTSDTIRNFEEQMKDDNIKTVVEFLEDDKVSERLCEVKNERITGDSAVAKIFIDSYPSGLDVYFEKENGEWRMTNKSPSFEAVKQSNSNAAK